MATLTGEAKKLVSVDTAKDVGFTLVGLYGSHIVANMIPWGPKTGYPQVAKLGAATVLMGWAGDKFMGASVGSALFTGGAVLTGLELVGVITKGQYGAIPNDQAPALPTAKTPALPGPQAQATQAPANNATGDYLAASYSSAGF